MNHLPEALISGLSADAGLSVVELGQRVDDYTAAHEFNTGEYYVMATVVSRFLNIQRQKGMISFDVPHFQKEQLYEFIQWFKDFTKEFEITRAAEIAASRVDELLSMEDAIRENQTFGIAQLNAEEKDQVRAHIVRAREIVSESKLSDRKKNAILERLLAAERELETIGTRTDRFFTLMGDTAFVLGEMAEKAKPLTTEVREILKIVFRGRENAEGVRIPKSDDPLLLPPSEG